MNELFYGILPKNKAKILKALGSDFLTVNKDVNILSFVNQKDVICYVIEGKIKIVKNSYNGNNMIVDIIESGDIIQDNILLAQNSEYEIITLTKCEIVAIEYNQIINYNNLSIPEYDKFNLNLIKIMKERIKKNNERLDILTHKTIRNKLLTYFKNNLSNPSSRTIYLPSSYSALSDYLSVDRCAMTRELKNLKDEGLIETKGKIIKLKYYPDH